MAFVFAFASAAVVLDVIDLLQRSCIYATSVDLELALQQLDKDHT